jgi:hypothetical protein
MATGQQIETIAKRVSPDLWPSHAVSQINLFLGLVMASVKLEETITVEAHFEEPSGNSRAADSGSAQSPDDLQHRSGTLVRRTIRR